MNNQWIPVEVLPPMRCVKHEGVTFPKSNLSEWVLTFNEANEMSVGYYRFHGKTLNRKINDYLKRISKVKKDGKD